MTDFRDLFEDRRQLINGRIDDMLSPGLGRDEASELVKYTFKTGGKRLRPILLLLSCEAVGGAQESALDASVAVEFIHAASLIFDDLIDKDRLRRNLPTAHEAFNDDKAISSGLFLASRGVQILSEYKNPKIMKMIGWGLVELSRGEILDVISEIAIDVDQYLTIADLKTGSLFSASAGIGAILGGGNRAEINALYNYGRSVGVAFQIRDDVLDIVGRSNPGRLERANLVLAHYLGMTSKEERLSHILPKSTASARVDPVEAMRRKAVRFAMKKSREHVQKAKAELVLLGESKSRKMLEKFADFAFHRRG